MDFVGQTQGSRVDVRSLVQTCNAMPNQWEGEVEFFDYSHTPTKRRKGHLYFRARWESWRLDIADTLDKAVRGDDSWIASSGDHDNASHMETHEALAIIAETLKRATSSDAEPLKP